MEETALKLQLRAMWVVIALLMFAVVVSCCRSWYAEEPGLRHPARFTCSGPDCQQQHRHNDVMDADWEDNEIRQLPDIIRLATQTLELCEARHKAGTAPETEVLRARIQLLALQRRQLFLRQAPSESIWTITGQLQQLARENLLGVQEAFRKGSMSVEEMNAAQLLVLRFGGSL